MISGVRQFLSRVLGPGLLLAGAAIGVSHLVQATRAGADYGFALWWVLLFACITKYPFLEFGPRYAAATGETLVGGYQRLGVWPFRTFVFLTVGTMFIIQAAVTVVTAGLAEHFFQVGWSPFQWSAAILGGCVLLLIVGRYRALDLSMKAIISLLSAGTFLAVLLALGAGSAGDTVARESPPYLTAAGVAFLIALVGWMPIPLDAAVWHSIWSKDKARQQKTTFTLREVLLDFNIGYLTAAGLGFLFFFLGALVMFPTGESFPPQSVAFAAQLTELYAQTLGEWSRPLVAAAALTAMVSTTLAVTDAYPRVITHLMAARGGSAPSPHDSKKASRTYNTALCLIPLASLAVLYFLTGSFTLLVDFAAGLSFVLAPVLAFFNYRLVTGPQMPDSAQPTELYRAFSLVCLGLLTLFALAYLVWRTGLI